jgi:LPS sulfotransferase NodH
MKPVTTYIIASVQRSGTHLLCSILRSTGVAGSPGEFFLCKPGETWEERWGTSSQAAYVEGVLEQNTTTTGVFGTVVMWSYLDRMLQILQQIPTYRDLTGARLLAAVFNQPKYIWMRRGSRVEQAVSWAIACQTGVWAQKTGAQTKPRAVPEFDFKVIDEWCNRIAEHERGWGNYFSENQIEPLVLFYEDVVESRRAAAKHVLEFLGLPFFPAIEIAPPVFQKQANKISDEWAASYLKEKSKRNSRLARILRRIRI